MTAPKRRHGRPGAVHAPTASAGGPITIEALGRRLASLCELYAHLDEKLTGFATSTRGMMPGDLRSIW